MAVFPVVGFRVPFGASVYRAYPRLFVRLRFDGGTAFKPRIRALARRDLCRTVGARRFGVYSAFCRARFSLPSVPSLDGDLSAF